MGAVSRTKQVQPLWSDQPPELSQLPPRSSTWKFVALALAMAPIIGYAIFDLMHQQALAICIAIILSLVAVGFSFLGFRNQRRSEIVDNAVEQLGPLLRVRQLQRRLVSASKWAGGWVGTPRKIRIRYAKSINGRDPIWMGAVLVSISASFEETYVVKRHDHRAKKITLEVDDAQHEELAPPSEKVQKVQAIVRELLGESATIECSEDDNGITDVTVTHKQGVHMAMGGRRQRVERVIESRLSGRWNANWDLENDTVKFTQRPPMPTTVYPIYEPFDHADPHKSYLQLTIPYGVDENGTVISWQPSVNPHMLVVGGTGTGKTVVEHGLVEQLARMVYRVWIIDGKRIEFVGFRGYPNVELVASKVEHQVRMIVAAHELMEKRYTLIEAGKATLKDFDPLFVIIDEYATLRARILRWYKSVKPKGAPTQPPVVELIEDLARLARSAKIHMVLGLQRPDVTFLGGEMRDNFAARISMGRLSPQGANMMWDSFAVGVALPRNVRGRGVSTNAESNPVEIQTFWNPDPSKGDLPEYLEASRPLETKYPRKMILPPDMEADLDGNSQDPETPATYYDYAEARIVDFDELLIDEVMPDQPVKESSDHQAPPAGEPDEDTAEDSKDHTLDEIDTTAGLFEGYLPSEEGRPSSAGEGDLVLVDESLGLWGVIEGIDFEDNDYVILDYRDLESGEIDSISISDTTRLEIRRPKNT